MLRSARSSSRLVLPALTALLSGLLSPALAAQEASGGGNATAAPADAGSVFEATLLRTWTGDDLTIVDGLAQVPLAMMAGGTTDTYRFELTVFDSDGVQLYRDSWNRELSERVTAVAGAEASTLLEPFQFGVRPGDYDIELRAYPTDAPDIGVRARLSVSAYDERPSASDLFLADRVEPLEEGGGGSWSITHGGFGISAVARTTVLPQEPRLFYYAELYDGQTRADIDYTAEVVGKSGAVIYATPPTTAVVPEGGLPLAGSLSLAGLPPGAYRLRLRVNVAGESFVREAPFRMLDWDVSRLAQADTYESRYFASLGDRELEDMFGGVGYLLSESERQAYESLPADAKRRYLTEFFASRNRPGASDSSFLEEYIERVGAVRALYGEMVGTRERRPWTTDAGRIYLRYGAPDERVINHFPASADTEFVGGGALQGEPPYEIWGYHSTGHVYLFVQENQLGVWRMIFTTDPNMRSLADWTARVGGEALRDMTTKFGIQPR